MRTPGSSTCARCKTASHLSLATRPVALHRPTYPTGLHVISSYLEDNRPQIIGLFGMSPVAMQEASLTGIRHAHDACAVVLVKVCVCLLLGRSCCGGLCTLRKGRRRWGWRSTGSLNLRTWRSCAGTTHRGLRRAGQATQPSCAAHCMGYQNKSEEPASLLSTWIGPSNTMEDSRLPLLACRILLSVCLQGGWY